jgi:hypothetical protein
MQMLKTELVKTLNDLCKEVDEVLGLAATAKRNGKSLGGSGFYGDKFHDASIRLGTLQTKCKAPLQDIEAEAGDFDKHLAVITRADSDLKSRQQAVRDFKHLCQSKLIPLVEASGASPVPVTEQVLPDEVVKGTRGYLEKIIQQANGCYEHQWYDACSVMVRKFIEILIIHSFEAHNIADRIKGRDGNFLMLGDLVDKMLAETAWNLGRETKACLPLVRELGNRAAHNRTFIARKQDVDNALVGFRVTAEELLHIAKLR